MQRRFSGGQHAPLNPPAVLNEKGLHAPLNPPAIPTKREIPLTLNSETENSIQSIPLHMRLHLLGDRPIIPGERGQHAPLTLPSLPTQRGQHAPLIVGILGASTAYTEVHINQLIKTITQLWGKPAQLIFQQSGTAMMFIESWAETNHIPCIPVQPEWAKYGPKACFYVNNKIEKEATHIVIIRSPRAKSDKMLVKAEQLSSKKGKPCLVLMDIETNGSAVIDCYEKGASDAPLKPPSKSKSNGMQNICDMFLNASLKN